MKYGYYSEGEWPLSINNYREGSHIIVVRNINNFVSTTIKLEDLGWAVRDCIKILMGQKSVQATLLRKPFKGTVANNVLTNGCGGLNIDACRIQGGGTIDNYTPSTFSNRNGSGLSKSHIAGSKDKTNEENDAKMRESQIASIEKMNTDGRFPANLLISNNATLLLNKQSGDCKTGAINPYHSDGSNSAFVADKMFRDFKQPASSGGASRFFFNFDTEKQLKDYLINLIKV